MTFSRNRNKDSPRKSLSEPSAPSRLIDAAVFDLIIAVSQFSDDAFDSHWLDLTAKEIEFLTVKLLQNLTKELQGQTLKLLLEEFRLEKG